MTAAVALGALAAALLVPLAVAGLRQRALLRMALRNIRRRRAEAVLVVAGALLGTAVITSSLVVGDVIEGSFADAARITLGPVDLTVTPNATATFEDVDAAVRAAAVDGVDGLLSATTSTASLEAPEHGTAAPQIAVVELDVEEAQAFGPDVAISGLAGVEAPGAAEILVNAATAERLDVTAGDQLRVHAYGQAVDLVVSQIVAEVGLAGYGGAIVAPGTFGSLADAGAAAPRTELLVSVDGAIFPDRALADAVGNELRAAVAHLDGIEVAAPKAAVLDDAERQGSGLSTVFSGIGMFSVLAGVLLLVNLFVMLAEERKTELGMLRAVGFTRRRLVRAFALEGAVYAIVAAAAGAVAGIGIGWVVAAVAGPMFGTGGSMPLVVEPLSLATGALAGLAISLLTIWATSLRIARLNIIRAIRDLPEPGAGRTRLRTRVLSVAGVIAGAALAVLGFASQAAVPLLLGVPVAAFSAGPLLRGVLPARTARLLVAIVVLGWGLGVNAVFPEVMGGGEMAPMVVGGVVLTAGAVALASDLDRVWTLAIQRLGRRGRGLGARLGVAYPLAHRFRTAMSLGMFSLVIFTVTLLTALSSVLGANTGSTVTQLGAGFDVVLDSNPTNPITAAELAARPDVAAVAAVARGIATFSAPSVDGTRTAPVTGYDAELLAHGGPALLERAAGYASDADAYWAVLADPSLVIAPGALLATGTESATLAVGDTVTLMAAGGEQRELTIAALGGTDWLANGALVSREVTDALLGAGAPTARTYVEVADGADAEAVAAELNAAFLAQGADARTFDAVASAGAQAFTGFLAILRGFLSFGLLVGIAGVSVVMVRAVRERRREIGMLRAMGFGSRLVRTAMLVEAGLVAGQGTVIGAALGLLVARQLLSSSDAFGGEPVAFAVPWVGLALIVVLPLAAALAASAWPAARASAIRPAIALRIAD